MREGMRRELPQHQFGVRGTLYSASGRVGTNVTIRKIGAQGCELGPVEGLSAGGKCELYFDWKGTQLGFKAQVVWIDAERRSGLDFLAVDTESRSRLEVLCASLPADALAEERDAARPVAQSAEVPEAARPAAVAEAAPSLAPRPAAVPRRQLPRYLSALPAHFSNLATGGTAIGTLVNLSMAGGRLESPWLPEAGQKCEFHTEWEGERVLLRCDVVWKDRREMGVKFSPLDDGTQNLLRRICSNLRPEPLARLPLGR